MILVEGESLEPLPCQRVKDAAEKACVAQHLEALKDLCDDVLVVTMCPGKYQHLDVAVVSEILPGAGFLGKLLTALVHTRGRHCLMVAEGAPVLRKDLVGRMMALGNRYDAIVQEGEGREDPVLGLYSKRCLAPVEKLIGAGQYHMSHLGEAVRALVFDEGWPERSDP